MTIMQNVFSLCVSGTSAPVLLFCGLFMITGNIFYYIVFPSAGFFTGFEYDDTLLRKLADYECKKNIN
jgi:hypothetical protein